MLHHPEKKQKRVHLPNGLHSDKSAEKNFEFRRLLLHVGTRSLISLFPGFIPNWSAARCMVPKKKSIKTSALFRWTAKGDKIVTCFLVQEKKKKRKLLHSNHWRQKAKRTATTNYFTLADRRTKSKSVGFSVSFKQACNPTGSQSERSPKQKPQSTDSDRRASSR